MVLQMGKEKGDRMLSEMGSERAQKMGTGRVHPREHEKASLMGTH